MSQDFEDIMFLFEHRKSIWQEMKDCDPKLNAYLHSEFARISAHPDFAEWVDGHAGFGYPPATYMIIDRVQEFLSIK